MKILTLNLHTYQELSWEKEDTLCSFLKKYRPIQETIANFITEKNVDFAFFQEAGQYIDDEADMELFGVLIKKSNYVRILSDILFEQGRNYYFTWDVSHYGFGVWEEGLGILSKYPIVEFESRYVSRKDDLNTFYSRKIIRARVYVGNNITDLYCAHFNWKEAGFVQEFSNLVNWIEEVGNDSFVIAGDFNIPYGSEEYLLVINTKIFGKRLIDAWVVANPEKTAQPTFRGDILSKESERIDYIFIPEGWEVKDSEIVFDKERVSDHMGVFCEVLNK
jgi:maltose 6'-phosphate phosphatase